MATSRLIRWGPHYQLGNPSLDRQHQELIELLNRLYTQWQQGVPRASLAAALRALVAAIRAHFRTEEQLMARHRYAGLDTHKAEHRSFAREVTAFERDFRTGRAHLDQALFDHLAAWLRHHLLASDKPMGEAIGRRGRAPLRRTPLPPAGPRRPATDPALTGTAGSARLPRAPGE
jgi:hemerythrin